MKRKFILICTPAALLLIAAVLYLLIPVFVKSYVKKKVDELQQEKDISLVIKEIDVTEHTITGKIALELKGITLKSNEAEEQLLAIDRIHTEIQAWRGFRITKSVNELSIDSLTLHLVKRGDYCNYPFLNQKDTTAKNDPKSYRDRVESLIDKLNRYCPNTLNISHLDVYAQLDSAAYQYCFSGLAIQDGQVSGLLAVMDEDSGQRATHWQLKGSIDQEATNYAGEIELLDTLGEGGAIHLPVRKLANSDFRFRKAAFNMSVAGSTDSKISLALSGHIQGLRFHNKYVSENPIVIESAGGDLNLDFFASKVVLDSTSTLQLNRTVMHPFVCYEKGESKHITLKINEKRCNAQQLFASLPEGLFVVAPKLKVQGNIDYHLLFDCDFAHVDDLRFDFGIGSSDRSFRICEGEKNITYVNDAFNYIFYDKEIGEDGEEVDFEIVVPIDSVENPYFCPFAQIPQHLTNSILVSEDPSFFRHRGYIKDAIRNAMIADIKAKKMVRGGSTISQQLIKNLYLNRKKVFSRKFEELLLVWMIEDYRLIEKERMFEIYVNIVEWAPKVIGIGQAAEFYFGKSPGELTLGECAYLATLIRSPKSYKYTLDEEGVITANRQAELKFLFKRMAERELISADEAAHANLKVQTHIQIEEEEK